MCSYQPSELVVLFHYNSLKGIAATLKPQDSRPIGIYDEKLKDIILLSVHDCIDLYEL